MPKVSILIPVYNTEKFIGQAIESILIQSYTDFELVIVDDCSTDDTYDICREYAKNDERIRLYRNENNLGMMPNWNYGLRLCQGEYWGKLDADDWWCRDMISESVAVLDKRVEVGMVCTRYVNVDEQGREIEGSAYSFPVNVKGKAISFIPFVKAGIDKMFSHHIAQQGNSLIRKNIFDKTGPFTLMDAGDTEMWFRIGGHMKIYCVDKLCHFHRVWAQNFTRKEVLGNDKSLENLQEVRAYILQYYHEQGFISNKEYKALTADHNFEVNKYRSAKSRYSGNIVKSVVFLGKAFANNPSRALNYYLRRKS